MKDLDQLARDMRANAELRDAVAMVLATSTAGDWSALTAKLSSLGYGVSADELQDKLRSTPQPDAPHAQLLARWL